MKKHRKLLALLVALTFLFSIAAPVMAAPTSAEEKAAGTLNALGIIEGYEDGSFGLERDITRAEFAKIAVMAAGFGDAEPLMKNTPSKFSDVATGAWYTGWINLASAQGYVKGDPSGTFRPNDKITYAEVVTVLLRLVGYSDNLPGDWPMNYLTKAVQLGVTKGVSFDASSPAVRGSVFALTEKTLDVPMVTWSKDKDVFEEKLVDGNKVKLIANSFKGTMSEGLVTDLSWNSKGVASLKINVATKNGFDTRNFVVAKNAVISGASDVVALLANRVDFVVNDDNEITYVGAKATSSWTSPSGAATAVNGNKKVAIGPPDTPSMTYDWATDVDLANLGNAITYFPSKGDLELINRSLAMPGIVPGTADKVVGVFDKKGNVEHVFVYNYTGADLIEEIDGSTIFGEVGTFKKGSSDQVVVVRNGVVASYYDLEEGDYFYAIKGADARGLDALIFASDVVKSGVVDEYTMSGKIVNSVTIDGVKYYVVPGGALVSDNNGKDYNGEISKDTVNKDVEFMLSPGGKIGVFVSNVKATSDKLYGILQAYDTNSFDGNRVKIFTQEGKSVTYTATKAEYNKAFVDSDNDDKNGKDGGKLDGATKEKTLVSYELDSKGNIENLAVVGTATIKDVEGTRVQIGNDWYRVSSDTSIFRRADDGSGKLSVVDWADAKDSIAKAKHYALVMDGNKIVAIAYEGAAASSDTYGIIAGSGYNAGGYYYDIFVDGKKVRYNITSKATEGIAKNSVVTFQLTDGKVSNIKSARIPAKEVTKVGSDYIELYDAATKLSKYYDLSKDVMYVDVTGRDPVIASRVSRGAMVEIYDVDKEGFYKLVVIGGSYVDRTPDPEAPKASFTLDTKATLSSAKLVGNSNASVTVGVYVDPKGKDNFKISTFDVNGADRTKIVVEDGAGGSLVARLVSGATYNKTTNMLGFTLQFEKPVWVGDTLKIKAGAITIGGEEKIDGKDVKQTGAIAETVIKISN